MEFSKGLFVTFLIITLCDGAIDWDAVVNDIRSHQNHADQIIDYVTNGAARHGLYDEMVYFSDKFGPRFVGTKGLSDAIEYMRATLQTDGFSNVHVESFTHPSWTRANETATLLQPREAKMDILGLIFSVGTPTGGIEEDVIVVKSFEELTDRASEAVGKIVVFNNGWNAPGLAGYREAKSYRTAGAQRAAEVGAKAALIRSAASASIYSPHTGMMQSASIPGVSITVEDAEMLQRMQDRGDKIRIRLEMDSHSLPPDTSSNVIAEITGSKYPDELVIVTGHMDSMDIGTGSEDNAGGMLLAAHVLRTVKALGFTPKRTIRFASFSAEEIGGVGVIAYLDAHLDEVLKSSLMMNADSGVFRAKGVDLGFASGMAIYLVEEILQLLASIDATEVTSSPFTERLINITYAFLSTQNEKYFDYHHSKGDTPLVLDADEMDTSLALWTTLAFVLADIEERLPLAGDYPASSSATNQFTCRPPQALLIYSLITMAITLSIRR